MTPPPIVLPRGGSGTAPVGMMERARRRRELAREILLTLLARDDLSVPSVIADPEVLVGGALALADLLLKKTTPD